MDNAERHGNKYQEELMIHVLCSLRSDKLLMAITDQGEGFDWQHYMNRAGTVDPLQSARDRHKEAEGRGGLGIALMKRCADAVEYNAEGNCVTLCKSL